MPGDKRPDGQGDKPDENPRLRQKDDAADFVALCMRGSGSRCRIRSRFRDESPNDVRCEFRRRGTAILDDIDNSRYRPSSVDWRSRLDDRYYTGIDRDHDYGVEDIYDSLPGMRDSGLPSDTGRWETREVRSRRPRVDREGRQMSTNGRLDWDLHDEPIIQMNHKRVSREVEGISKPS